MATTNSITTAEELLRAAPNLGRCELVRGELVMNSPAGAQHGRVVARITIRLGAFVEERGLGELYGAETGFLIARDPDTVRAPDVAFVCTERARLEPRKGYFEVAPDLAVEVLSPDDRAGEVLAKVYAWLDAGCRAVWVVDPESRTVTAYRSRTQITALGPSDQLTGEDVVPGFSIPVADVFATQRPPGGAEG
jgi:Uma2 family endonuclease